MLVAALVGALAGAYEGSTYIVVLRRSRITCLRRFGSVRVNSKGQVTIPAQLREKHGLREGDEVEVVEDDEGLRIVRVAGSQTRGQRLVAHMRGRATTDMSTDDLLGLLRDD